jgi:CBS domain-containing protein
MSTNPACCGPETSLQDVARMMVDHDCGEIPVVDRDNRPVGVITDRDITCRTVAQGRNPLELHARDCMSSPVVTGTPDMDVDECCRKMEHHMIRRLPIVDAQGSCCGIVSQADIARSASARDTAELVRDVSAPTHASLH